MTGLLGTRSAIWTFNRLRSGNALRRRPRVPTASNAATTAQHYIRHGLCAQQIPAAERLWFNNEMNPTKPAQTTELRGLSQCYADQ